MMEKGLLIFDLDGTIIDTSEDIAWAANRTIEAFGRAAAPVQTVKENIGWGVKALLERLMPGLSPMEIEGARLKFLDFYAGHLAVRSFVYPGVRETFEHFRALGKLMAVVTNKPAGLSERLLGLFGLNPFFRLVIGGDSLSNKKPHPEPLLKVLDTLGISAGSALFVGDSPTDSETGRNAGVFTIGVSYGFRPLKEVQEAGFGLIIDDFSRLRDIIR